MNNDLKIIAPGFVSQTLYDTFAGGWLDTNIAPLQTHEVKDAYSMMLYQGETPGEFIIWVFSEHGAAPKFDSFWLILRNLDEEKRKRILFHLHALFYLHAVSEIGFQDAMTATLERVSKFLL